MKHTAWGKKEICILLAVLLFLPLCMTACATDDTPVNHDLSTLYGVPEYYNVQWDMTISEVDELIKIDHETYSDPFTKTYQIISEEPYEIGGLECSSVGCLFKSYKLYTVLFLFHKTDVDFDDVADIFIDIYGEPHNSADNLVEWEGSETFIDVYDEEVVNDGLSLIVARYRKLKAGSTESAQPSESMQPLETIQASGFPNPVSESNLFETIDPLGYLNYTPLLGTDINAYIGDMVKNTDYQRRELLSDNESTGNSYVSYRFTPEFEYMGYNTTLVIYTRYKSDTINMFQYAFTWNSDGADTLVKSIKELYLPMQAVCGEPCLCAVKLSTDFRLRDVSIDTLYEDIVSQTPGLYYIQWDYNNTLITIFLSFTDEDHDIEGGISFASK